MTALEDLNGLLSSLPGYGVLNDTMKGAALEASRIPDAAGVWPEHDGYVTTYDIYFAAMRLLGFMQAQPFVKQSASEGTAVTVDPPNWGALAAYYRSMSVIAGYQGNAVLTSVPIPDGPHVVRTDMSGYDASGRRTDYGDVDSDVG